MKRLRRDPQAFERALAAYRSGNRYSAELVLRQVLQREPTHAAAHYVLGLIALDKGEAERAYERFSEAVRLEPANAGFCSNRAEAARRLGHLDEAIELFEHALLLDPALVPSHFNLGLAYDARGELRLAQQAFRAALDLRPTDANLMHRLARAHRDLGDLDAAAEQLREALGMNPDDQRAHAELGSVLFYLGRHHEALAALERALTLDPHDAASHSALVYQLSFHPTADARRIREEAECFATRHAAPLSSARPQSYDVTREPERRLRIGYVSADFREHVTGNVVLPLLRHHDREQVDVYLYSAGNGSDHVTQRFREHASVFREIAGLDDERAAALIQSDRIDILVDLSMHMAKNRLLLFARKPAPIQVSWFAYPGTTGLDCIDYRVSDSMLDPPELGDDAYTEATVRLPDSFWCWEPLLPSLETGEPPCTKNGYVTFGSLNNFCKMNDAVIELWAQVLRAIPESRLMLMVPEGSSRVRVREQLARHGVDAARTELVGHRPRRAYFELYRQIDIALDPLPYHGHTTSIDALWMGVPVLSLLGRTLVGRAALSQAACLGLTHLVAQSAEELVERATDLASSPAGLAELRRGLRARLAASPLMDGPRFARHFEAVYRQVWRKWCEVLA